MSKKIGYICFMETKGSVAEYFERNYAKLQREYGRREMFVIEFRNWLMDKFLEWEKTQTGRQSYSAFARYLNVKTATLTQWRLGSYTPTGENLVKVAEKLGTEVYRFVGLPTPEAGNVPTPAEAGFKAASDRITAPCTTPS